MYPLVVVIETAPEGNFSHAKQIHDFNYTHQLMNFWSGLLGIR